MRPPAHALALAAVFVLATTVGGPTAVDVPSDLPVYRGYATALLDGLVPYRDFGVEYPPLALVPIALAGLFGTGAGVYAWAFGAVMLAAALVAQRAAARLAGPRHGRAVAWGMVLLPVAAGAIVRTRFDLVPAALMLAALVAVVGRRPTLGLALLGGGTATKLFPAVVAGVALAWLAAGGRAGRQGRAAGVAGRVGAAAAVEGRAEVAGRRGSEGTAPGGAAREGGTEREAGWRGAEWPTALAAFAAVLVLTALPFLIVSPAGFVDQFAFHVKRPVQIESLPATLLWLFTDPEVTGAPVRPDEFKSNGLDHPAASPLAAAFALAQLVAVLAAIVLAARRPGDVGHLVIAAFAALLAFVTLGKVLSPQYLLWLAPLALAAAAHGARAPAALVLLAVPLTQAEFPHRYFDLVNGDAATIGLIAARNGLLLVALALVLRRLAAAPARSPLPFAAPARSE